METLLNIRDEIRSLSYTKEDITTLVNDSKIAWISSGTSSGTLWTGTSNFSTVSVGSMIVYYLTQNNTTEGDAYLSLSLKNGDTVPSDGNGKPIKYADGTILQAGSYKKGDIFLLLNTNQHWLIISYASHNEEARMNAALEELRNEMMEYINMENYQVEITNPILDDQLGYAKKGIVKYTANIKDQDNNAVEGVLVKFEKHTGELLGEAVSDNTGNANLETTHDTDFFKVIANVNSTPCSNSINVYINEEGNLFPTNVWTGTSELHKTNGFNKGPGADIAVSTDWYSIGDSSLSFKRVGANNFYIYANSKADAISDYNLLTCKFDILTGEQQVVCRVGSMNYASINSVTVPASNEKQTIIITQEIPDFETLGRLTILPQGSVDSNKISYIDNIYLFGSVKEELAYYDPCTSVNGGTTANPVAFTDRWVEGNKNNGSLNIVSSGTTLTNTAGAGTNYLAFANKFGSGAENPAYDWCAPFTVEFDIIAFEGSPVFQMYDSTTNEEMTISATGHYKYTYDGTTLKTWIDNVAQEDISVSFAENENSTRIGFKLGANSSVTFKEFKIYNVVI